MAVAGTTNDSTNLGSAASQKQDATVLATSVKNDSSVSPPVNPITSITISDNK